MNTKYEVFYGRLGQDPELKYVAGPNAVCSFSVAIPTEVADQPIWKKVVVWGRQAELCEVQLKKGSEVFVQGQTQQKEFINKEGVLKRYEEVSARLVGFSNI